MILSCYDIMGIQRFVFASNKMKENVGASVVVDIALSEWLIDCIPAVESHVLKDWKEANEFTALKDSNTAEILYIGGGNAVIAYDSKETYLKVNKAFSKKLLEETAGELSYASAWVETTEVLSDDIKKLFEELTKTKQSKVPSLPLQGIAITREGMSDGLPALHKNSDGEYISQSSFLKSEQGKKRKEYLEKRFTGFKFPDTLDDLGMIEANNYIAVVHIDGNDMGKLIREAVSQKCEYNSGVQMLRNLSKEISNIYMKAFRGMLDALNDEQKDENFAERFKIKHGRVLIEPLVVNGDDITFVCDGRLGLALAQHFLKTISKSTVDIYGSSYPLSACAGISIVKAHFPFFRAYDLAEQLCSNAKRKAKFIDVNKPGCWLDWHIAQSGIINDLGSLRQKHYNVSGLSQASIQGVKVCDYTSYNLLWRPWRLDGGDMWDIAQLYDINNYFETKARSKVKSLRNTAIESSEAIQELLVELKSRKVELPKFTGVKDFYNTHNISPFFDALESSDFLYQLKSQKQEG